MSIHPLRYDTTPGPTITDTSGVPILPDGVPANTGSGFVEWGGEAVQFGTVATLRGQLNVGQGIYNVMDPAFGAKGDGVTDDSAAINAAIAAANNAGGGTVVLPAGYTFLVASQIVLKSGITLWGYGAKVVCGIADLNTSTIYLGALSGVRLCGFEVDGQQAQFAETQGKHNVHVLDCSRVWIADIYSHDAKGDGLYIGGSTGATHSDRVFVRDAICDSNHRNGLSITDLSHGRFSGCQFTNSAGTAPQAGVDIEPNFDSANIADIDFVGCRWEGNTGDGCDVIMRAAPSGLQKGVRFQGGSMSNNTGSGLLLSAAYFVEADGVEVYGNGQFGIGFANTSNDIVIRGGRIAMNGSRGVSAVMNANQTLLNVVIADVIVEDNGSSAANTLDGLRFDGAAGASLSHIALVGVISRNRVSTNQRYGVTSTSLCSSMSYVGCDFVGNQTGTVLLADGTSSRNASGNTAGNMQGPIPFPIQQPGTGDITLTPGTDGECQLFDTAITAARNVNMTLTNAFPGATFIITRSLNCTGAFNINIINTDATTIKSLTAAGQWVRVRYSNTLAKRWYVEAAGNT